MTAPTPPLPELLRAAADWFVDGTISEFDAAHPWVNRESPNRRIDTLAKHLRSAAARLEAEQPAPDWISLQQLRHELGEERDEKAKHVAELQRLRDENAKLRVDTIMPMQAEIDLWRGRAEWLLGEMRKEADRG